MTSNEIHMLEEIRRHLDQYSTMELAVWLRWLESEPRTNVKRQVVNMLVSELEERKANG